ncbi:MAG TPA: RNA 2',3'-cyclic phosphodiesterase [Pengzhenrongella sp.]
MRLFVAVVPPAGVREHLELALTAVRGLPDRNDARGPLRWAPADDRHVTLAFFGEVSAGEAEELSTGLGRVADAHAPFELRLRGAGVFDRRIFWIGCGGEVAALGVLTAHCVELGRDVTGRADRRVRSRSHLTVARVRGQSRGRGQNLDDVAALAHALAVYEGPTWWVEEMALVSSRPGEGRAGGPAYDALETYPLRGSASPGGRP